VFEKKIAKLAEMQQELRDSKRLLKEAVTEKEAFEAKYNDVVDSMEVTMLDKEMAEERAENLQHEVNTLRERVDEMHVDLNVYQQGEGNPHTSPLLSMMGPCSTILYKCSIPATCIHRQSSTQNFLLSHANIACGT
jgi:hypothetical protein